MCGKVTGTFPHHQNFHEKFSHFRLLARTRILQQQNFVFSHMSSACGIDCEVHRPRIDSKFFLNDHNWNLVL